jgi:hypothetical protein
MKRCEHKGLYLKFNKVNDRDIIERLDKQANKQGYIKDLIRTDIDLDIFRGGVETGVIKIEKTNAGDSDQS